MQVSDFPVLRTVICVVVSVLAGCSGIPSGMVQSNLVAGSVQVTDAAPIQGESFQVTFTFSNTGVATNDSGFVIRLRIEDDSGAPASANLDQRFAGSLAEDEITQVSWTISSGLAAGFYTAIASLDVDGEVTESTTSDNSNSRDFEVVAAEEKNG